MVDQKKLKNHEDVPILNNISSHILSTSTNLLGFCLVTITTINGLDKSESTHIDEFISSVAMLLIFSALLSYFSIRSKSTKCTQRLETIAEYFFVAALMGVLIIVSMMALNFIN